MKRTSIATLIVALAFTTNAFAVGEARLTGTVTDDQGNPIPEVTITVTATEKMTFKKEFKTDESGDYAIFLLDGTIRYEFAFSKDGFSTVKEVWKLDLAPAKNVQNIVLKPATQAGPGFGAPAPANPAFDIYNAGVELANSGDDPGAIAKFEEAVEIDPELSAGWTALTRVYSRTKEWKKAIEAGKKTLDLVGEDELIAAMIADAYTMLGDDESAKEYRQLAPPNPAVLFNEAVPHLNANRDAEAESLLKKAIEVDETFAKAHYELGALYARQGKNDEAKKHLMRYLELEPEGENAAFAREMVKYLD